MISTPSGIFLGEERKRIVVYGWVTHVSRSTTSRQLLWSTDANGAVLYPDDEGRTWIRGNYREIDPEGAALLAAEALTR